MHWPAGGPITSMPASCEVYLRGQTRGARTAVLVTGKVGAQDLSVPRLLLRTTAQLKRLTPFLCPENPHHFTGMGFCRRT